MPDNRFLKPLKGDNAFNKKRPLKPETVQAHVLDFLESLDKKLGTIATNTEEYKQIKDLIAILKAYKLPESLSVDNFPPELTGKKPLGVNVANWPKALTDGNFGAKSEVKIIKDDKEKGLLSSMVSELKKIRDILGNVLTFKSPFHQEDKNALAVKWQAEQLSKLIKSIDGSSTGPFDAAIKDVLTNIYTYLQSAANHTVTNNGTFAVQASITNLGQQLAAASVPVVLTAAQLATLTPPAAITGFSTETTLALIKAKTDNIPALGQALAAGSVPVVLTAAQLATLTPPTSVDVTSVPTSDKFDPVLVKTQFHQTVDFTASQTGSTIWTPNSGKRFVITDYDLSFSGAGTLTVFDGSDTTANRVIKMYGAVNGGAVHAYKMPWRSSAVNNVLKYTTGAGAAGSITFNGYEE